jgi:hypothetical protein
MQLQTDVLRPEFYAIEPIGRATANQHVRAKAGEGPCDCFANPAAAAGHDGCFSSENVCCKRKRSFGKSTIRHKVA